MTHIPPTEPLSYESALAELETIVAALESNQLSLEESVQRFERGQALARYCADKLETAGQKVQQLSGGQLSAFEGSE